MAQSILHSRNFPEVLRSLAGESVAQKEPKDDGWVKLNAIIDSVCMANNAIDSKVTTVKLVPEKFIKITPLVCLECTKQFFKSRGMPEKHMDTLEYEFEKNKAVGAIQCWKLGIQKGWITALTVHLNKELPVDCPNEVAHAVCQEPENTDYPLAI